MKVDIPFFDGYMEMENFLEWMNTVEYLFEYMGTPEVDKVKLVAYKFYGGAVAWWEHVRLNHQNPNPSLA